MPVITSILDGKPERSAGGLISKAHGDSLFSLRRKKMNKANSTKKKYSLSQ